MSIANTLVIEILLKLLVCQIKAGTIGHMHHKTSGSKALCLLFLNAGDFFFGVTYRSVMFLRFLLHNLILKKLLIHLKFLTVTGYAGLAGVNWALDRCDHIQ